MTVHFTILCVIISYFLVGFFGTGLAFRLRLIGDSMDGEGLAWGTFAWPVLGLLVLILSICDASRGTLQSYINWANRKPKKQKIEA